MDTSGAALGLLTAAVVVYMVQRNMADLEFETYRWLIILGIIPAFLALFFFIFIHEPSKRKSEQAAHESEKTASADKPSLASLGPQFNIFLVIMFLFTLGNSSDAFLILRAQNLGNNVLLITLMLFMFNIVYALFSIPAGVLSDKIGRRWLITIGWAVYAMVYLSFALIKETWMVWLLFAFYGLYYGLMDGVARAMVSDLVPEDKRGTAFGLFNGVVGFTLLPASLIAGWLWQAISPEAPFYFGSALAFVAILGLLIFIRQRPVSQG